MIKTAIVNMVVTATLNQELDLDEIGKLRGVLHDSNVYGGRVAYFKLSDMKGKVSLFASGKTVVAGLTSSNQIKPVIQEIVNMIRVHSKRH